MSLMMSGQKGISAFPDGDKLLSWIATVQGPEGSVYEGEEKSSQYCRHNRHQIMLFVYLNPIILGDSLPLLPAIERDRRRHCRPLMIMF